MRRKIKTTFEKDRIVVVIPKELYEEDCPYYNNIFKEFDKK